MFDSFENKVKIKESPLTKEKGLAGCVGVVHGQTTPSKVDIEIIGTPKEDLAINVYFDELNTSFWFEADLLELIDDGQGTIIKLDGIDKQWTKGKEGQWIEENTTPKATQITKTKWWEFWK